jgi:hypothetical protein
MVMAHAHSGPGRRRKSRRDSAHLCDLFAMFGKAFHGCVRAKE